ncbi:MYG1 family protein [Candidatus Saccharibacteria bacterium]|nr:MYG1 family protein [Candidatus Saccharibacteria bacterium]
MEKISFHAVSLACEYSDIVTAVTHPAPFHADEVFATAILSLLQPVVLFRTRDQEIIDAASDNLCIVYDVGGVDDNALLRFDHHQRGFSRTRENDDIRLSSAGLIWQTYGRSILDALNCKPQYIEAVFKLVDIELIRSIDAADNGQAAPTEQLTVSELMALFNPNLHESEAWLGADATLGDDDAFLEAVNVAQQVMGRMLQRGYALAHAKRLVEDAIIESDSRILELPHFCEGWAKVVARSPLKKAQHLLYGVYQAPSGDWRLQSIPSDPDDRFSQRHPLPEAWRGLRDEELVRATGVQGAQFCHATGFIAVAATRDAILRLANLALATHKGEH